jgi:tRNA pseudouridine13 synthase
MRIKIKVKPEDFKVEEVVQLPFTKRGAFGVYRLTKKGWNTVGLLYELSKKLKIPFPAFAYGGKKDRYGLTSQYITIKNPERIKLAESDYSLEFFGFMERPMGPDLIRGNRFEIVARKLDNPQIKQAVNALGTVKETGYPNYFDDQRFGSFDSRQGFFAEKVLKGHFNGALKLCLTSIFPEDSAAEKKRKRFFFDHWKDWAGCLSKAESKFEKTAFDFLSKNPKGFLPLLKRMPKEEVSVYFSAYQSYLWNEVLRRIISSMPELSLRIYPGTAGDYIFYTRPEEKDFSYLKDLSLSTPGPKAKMPDDLSQNIYARVLSDNGIIAAMFNKTKLRQAFFKAFQREAIVIPAGLDFDVSGDEIYKGKKKLGLRFTLPAGSYGTMLIKRVFSVL